MGAAQPVHNAMAILTRRCSADCCYEFPSIYQAILVKPVPLRQVAYCEPRVFGLGFLMSSYTLILMRPLLHIFNVDSISRIG